MAATVTESVAFDWLNDIQIVIFKAILKPCSIEIFVFRFCIFFVTLCTSNMNFAAAKVTESVTFGAQRHICHF